VSWAFGEMLGSLKPLVNPITSLPCEVGGTVAQLMAAPTFNLDGLDLPDDAGALDNLLAQLHQSAAAAINDALAAGPDFATKFILQGIQRTDRSRFPKLNL
jgi:hypothetical protein